MSYKVAPVLYSGAKVPEHRGHAEHLLLREHVRVTGGGLGHQGLFPPARAPPLLLLLQPQLLHHPLILGLLPSRHDQGF